MAIRAVRTAAAIQRGVISGGEFGPAIVLLGRDRSAIRRMLGTSASGGGGTARMKARPWGAFIRPVRRSSVATAWVESSNEYGRAA